MSILSWVKILIDLFKQKGLLFKVHSTYDSYGKEKVEISMECPYCKQEHGGDGKKKLYLGFYYDNTKKIYQSRFLCFRCERKGTLDFLLETLKLKKEYQLRVQSKKKEDSDEGIKSNIQFSEEKSLNKDSYLYYKRFEEKNITYGAAAEYFERRGFDLTFLKKKDIIFITKKENDPFSKKFFGYALIPNYDYSNFVARSFMDSENKPRYLVYKAAHEKYGEELNKEDSNIYLVEGPLDALKLNQLGYNSWSYGGKSKILIFLENELNYIEGKKYTLILDADINIFKKDFLIGRKNQLLKRIPTLNFIHMGLTDFKDTGDIMNKKDFEEILKYKRGFDKRDLMEVRLLLLKKGYLHE